MGEFLGWISNNRHYHDQRSIYLNSPKFLLNPNFVQFCTVWYKAKMVR